MALDLLREFPEDFGTPTITSDAQSASDQSQSIDHLTARQREVLAFVSQGLTYKEIGVRLNLTERTIKYHMGEIVELLQVKNKAEAARLARTAGIQ